MHDMHDLNESMGLFLSANTDKQNMEITLNPACIFMSVHVSVCLAGRVRQVLKAFMIAGMENIALIRKCSGMQ